MRVGLIVEGRSEYAALPKLRESLSTEAGVTMVGPLLAAVSPTSAPAVIAREVRKHLVVLEQKGAERVVILLDKEDHALCCGERADEIAHAVRPYSRLPIFVVLKDVMFENWLIADVAALRMMPARFSITPAAVRAVAPDKADAANGYDWLQKATKGRYEKVADAQRILAFALPRQIGANSRSFRRFLRVIGHPDYASQSKRTLQT